MPTIEQCGRKLTLVTHPVANTIEEETLITQLEQYTNDLCIHLRLTHEPSQFFKFIQLCRYQRADQALHQISETGKLLAAVQAWHNQQESDLLLAQQLIDLMSDWLQAYIAWDNECIQQAQELIEAHWKPHMLYRLSYAPGINPSQPEAHPLDGNRPQHVKSIVTCTEPNIGRISYKNIDPDGEHSIQIILGGLLDYEPLAFESKPQINQPLPYHVCHLIGHHTVCLPPCNIEAHQHPESPPAPPELTVYLAGNGIEPLVADSLGLYLEEEIELDDTVQKLIQLKPDELVQLNPGGIF